VVIRGLRAAWRAQDEYAGYLAAGMTLFIGLQAFTNLAVAMGLLPTKGLALPFVSYGGSSLLVNAAAAGIILNTSRFGVSRSADVPADTNARGSQPRLRTAGGGAR
jgi:cell division protein FtsW